jgi:hypothetical protein
MAPFPRMPVRSRLSSNGAVVAESIHPRLPTIGGGRAWKQPRPANLLTLCYSQPGLPSWWRAASPNLNWIRSTVRRMAWASRGGHMGSLQCFNCSSRITFDHIPIRKRLETFTRGPMARKKKSRIQFTTVRRLVRYKIAAKPLFTHILTKETLSGFLASTVFEQMLWAARVPTPLTLNRAATRIVFYRPQALFWA